MSLEQAYRRIDQALRRRGLPPFSYVLWSAKRGEGEVFDYAIPLYTEHRFEIASAIEDALDDRRGRDRISPYAMQLARLALEQERRTPAA